MAKKVPKKNSNKSATAREYAAANPKATTQEIAKATGLSYTLVYQATKKKSSKKKKPGRKPGRKPGVAGKTGPSSNGEAAVLDAAIKLLKVAGSVQKAEEQWTFVRKVADAILVPF